jgi:hypothetical protein
MGPGVAFRMVEVPRKARACPRGARRSPPRCRARRRDPPAPPRSSAPFSTRNTSADDDQPRLRRRQSNRSTRLSHGRGLRSRCDRGSSPSSIMRSRCSPLVLATVDRVVRRPRPVGELGVKETGVDKAQAARGHRSSMSGARSSTVTTTKASALHAPDARSLGPQRRCRRSVVLGDEDRLSGRRKREAHRSDWRGRPRSGPPPTLSPYHEAATPPVRTPAANRAAASRRSVRPSDMRPRRRGRIAGRPGSIGLMLPGKRRRLASGGARFT